MKKSIYFRLAIAFIVIIFFGIALNMTMMYSYRFDEEHKDNLMQTAEGIVEIYKSIDEDEFEEFIQTPMFSQYSIKIYNIEDESIQSFTDEDRDFDISNEAKDKVKNNEVYIKHPVSSERRNNEQIIFGYPFELEGSSYALFISDSFVEKIITMGKLLRINIIVLIAVGSLSFIMIGKSIVYRINKLKYASQEVSKGNYEVEVQDRWNDEITDFMHVFNSMVKKIGKSEKMRQEFVSNVSHEIKSPITSIMGFANILQQEDINDEDRKLYLKIIEEESLRLSKLSENLLNLTSLENDQNIINKETYYLDEQIRNVILILEGKWSSKNIELNLDLPKTKINADKNLLKQVWINLIENSIKFSGENSSIDISIVTKGKNTTVAIKDYGLGISQENLDKIFERFYQEDESRNIVGSGLGLSIVKKIIDIHNAKIEVKSEINKGSEFYIMIDEE